VPDGTVLEAAAVANVLAVDLELLRDELTGLGFRVGGQEASVLRWSDAVAEGLFTDVSKVEAPKPSFCLPRRTRVAGRTRFGNRDG
jgi:hypothetical protein